MEHLIIKNGGVYRQNTSSSYIGSLTQLKSALDRDENPTPLPTRLPLLDRQAVNGDSAYRTKMFLCTTKNEIYAESKLERVNVRARVQNLAMSSDLADAWDFPEDHIPVAPRLFHRGAEPEQGEHTAIFPMGVPNRCHLSLIRKYSLNMGRLIEASLFMVYKHGEQLSLWRPLVPNVYDAGNICLGSLEDSEDLTVHDDWKTVEKLLDPSSFNTDIWDGICSTKVTWTANEKGELQQWWNTTLTNSGINRIAGQEAYHHIIGHEDE